MDVLVLAQLIGSAAKAIAAIHFLHTWGWGDAAWGDPILHPGEPDDAWHKRRRGAFNVMIVSSFVPGHWILSVILLVLIGAVSRQIFRAGVHKADPETYRRWYGG